jgi:hypothetical protein
MAKKTASGIRFINDQGDVVIRPSAGATSPSMPSSPSKPPAMTKGGADILASQTPIVSNDEQSSDVTSNAYVQNLDELLGGASAAPTASDIRKPVNTTEPGPNAGNDRPEVH